jgi:hypothetical protein
LLLLRDFEHRRELIGLQGYLAAQPFKEGGRIR